jgi:hypothetical protein
MSDEPKLHSVWQGAITVFGIDMICHVLNTGERVIEEQSMIALLEAFASGEGDPNHSEMDALYAFMSGTVQ